MQIKVLYTAKTDISSLVNQYLDYTRVRFKQDFIFDHCFSMPPAV